MVFRDVAAWLPAGGPGFCRPRFDVRDPSSPSFGHGREKGSEAVSPVAMVWPCPLSVDAYVAAGRRVEFPRPDCLSCLVPMMFWSGYLRHVRAGGPLSEDFRATAALRALPGDACAAAGVRAGLAAGRGGGDRDRDQ